MSRLWAGLAALLLALTACAGPHPPLNRITAACSLLASPAADLHLSHDLIPVERNLGGLNETLYACDYNRGSKPVLGLVVREFVSRGLDPQYLIASIGRRSRAQTTNVAGVGDAAIFYEQGRGFAVLATAKQAGPNIRLVTFGAYEPISANRLAILGAMVMDQL